MSAYLEPLDPGPRCQRWKLIVSTGSERTRRRRAKRFVGSKREAQAALRDYERTCRPSTSARDFETFARTWNDARLASGAIVEATHAKYAWTITAISPLLPNQLAKIRHSDILSAYAALKATRSGTSMRVMHNCLVRLFKAAVDDGAIAATPMQGVDAPQLDTRERRALSPSEVAALLDKLDISDNRQFAIALILRTGLRRGECVSLQWHDFKNGSLHIAREHTKTNAGVRVLPLDNETKGIIERRRALVKDALERAQDRFSTTYRLCCGVDGRPLTANALRLWWERNRSTYGLDGWTLHELRHTFLTNLAQAGVHPSIMQKIAGHASASTVMRIYTHVQDDDLRDAFSAVDLARKK